VGYEFVKIAKNDTRCENGTILVCISKNGLVLEKYAVSGNSDVSDALPIR